jgi:hypothetical protein
VDRGDPRNVGLLSITPLTQLLAREHFIEFSGFENSKLYARSFDGILQYERMASVIRNSKFYNIILKLFENSSGVVKSSNITEEKKNNCSSGIMTIHLKVH